MAQPNLLAAWLRDAAPINFWIGWAIAFVVTTALLLRARAAIGARRAVQDTPTALIRSAAQGYTEFRGMAALLDGEPIRVPASLRPCVWYRYRIQRREERGIGRERRSEWVTIEEGTSDALFQLVDTSGACVVDPDGAEVCGCRHDYWYGHERVPGRFHPPDATWFGRLGAGFTRRYRYSEWLIERDAALYVIGNFVTHASVGTAAGDFADAVAARLREWKRDRVALVGRFDRNGDGNVDPGEWEEARRHAENEIEAEAASRPAAPAIDVIGRTRDRRLPFIISAGGEDGLVRVQARIAAACLVLGVPLTIATLWALAARLGAH